jgi:hypothetical protein
MARLSQRLRRLPDLVASQTPPLEALPASPVTVALYLTALAEVRKPSTIRRRLASISIAHQVSGFETPTADAGVRAVWSDIRRRQGANPRKMRAARTKVITAMVAPLGNDLADARDRTLLLFGFAGALRRSERPRNARAGDGSPGRGRRPHQRPFQRARMDGAFNLDVALKEGTIGLK